MSTRSMTWTKASMPTASQLQHVEPLRPRTCQATHPIEQMVRRELPLKRRQTSEQVPTTPFRGKRRVADGSRRSKRTPWRTKLRTTLMMSTATLTYKLVRPWHIVGT